MKIKMRSHIYTVCALSALALISIFPVPARAADVEHSDAYDNSTVVKVVDGIRFQVPKDRPIEKMDGFIRPMPLDEYVSTKFSKLEERLQNMERSIEEMKNDIAAMKASAKPPGKKEGVI